MLAATSRERLADLDYDFDLLLRLMERLDLTTVQLVWRETPTVFHVRDPFPVGGVVEDAATGAAAAAFGAYSIVDPHGLHLGDAMPKLRGLAQFAETFGGEFQRVDAVAEVDDTLRVLDMLDAGVRAAVADETDARGLYLSRGSVCAESG